MKVQIRYESNRLDIFDTSTFTKAEPFEGANMLTNFEVRVDELGNTGLWLIAHMYETGESFANAAKEGETPTARRKRGWRFLLAEAGELSAIESLSIDGQIVLMKVAGELADMVRFEQMCDLWLPSAGGRSIAQRFVLLFDVLCSVFPETAADGDAIARMCGLSKRAIDEVRERTAPGFEHMDAEEEEEEDWLSGFYEEASDEEI